jgi:hypothetical protein
MPVCDRCSNAFPNYVKIDGQTHNVSKRRFCLDCSPFGRRNRRDLTICSIDERKCSKCKEIKTPAEFYVRSDATCCYSECKKCMMVRTKERFHQIKREAIEYKGGQCSVCGYNKCLAALEFHHRDPEEKDFEIGSTRGKSWSSIKAEIDKCDLLCANCHRELHSIVGA